MTDLDRHSDNGHGEREAGAAHGRLVERLAASPALLVAVMAISIFVAEAIVMVVLFYVLPPLSPRTGVFVDSAILLVMLTPILYFFLLRPLILLAQQREKAAKALRAETERVERYLDIAGVMIVVLDRDGRVALINRKGCEILGHMEADITGKDWFSGFLPEKNRKDARALFNDLISGKEEAAGYNESPVVNKYGEERQILWRNRVLMEEGKVAGTLSSGEDITERKTAEKALRESETKYRLLHRTAFDGIIISGADDRVVDCNPSAENIFGYEKGEMRGVPLESLMPEKYREKHREGLDRFLSTGVSRIQGRVVELEGLRKDGEIFPIELVLSSFAIGGKVHFTGSIRDITERKRAEEEKEAIQAQLNQSQKMEAIGRLAGGIAHDFNNILTTIRGNTEIAVEDTGMAHPAHARLQEITQAVQTASKLTRQLLLFSRGQPVEPVVMNINTVVANMLVIVSRLIGKDISVRTELYEGLWPVKADESGIEQVIMNLAVNARDAMPDGGTLSITTGNVDLSEEQCRGTPGASPGRHISITVGDTGKGMDRETAGRIFEPFFLTKEKGKGTGFGLAVVYAVVRQHDGWIRLKTAPSRGTAFTIYLPAAADVEMT